MPDRYSNLAASLSGPASHGFAVSPSDTIDQSETTRALYVGGSGSLAMVLQSGSNLVLANVPAGSLLPLRVTRILLTGTTATDIAGLV